MIERAGVVRVTADRARDSARSEAARMAEVRARGMVPGECGTDIPEAPARGAMTSFRPIELVPGTVGLARDTGHWQRGEDQRRRAGRIADVFDRIEADARRAHDARGAGAGRFTSPLTPAQVQIGRDYRNMVERHSAAGAKCASLEATGRGGGATGGEFMDAFVDEGIRIAALQRRIGSGVAMTVRRVRPSARGAKARGIITDRDLVDRVCLGDQTLGLVLDAHGWAVKGEAREALRKALCAALDRMMGYDRGLPTK